MVILEPILFYMREKNFPTDSFFSAVAKSCSQRTSRLIYCFSAF